MLRNWKGKKFGEIWFVASKSQNLVRKPRNCSCGKFNFWFAANSSVALNFHL